MRWPSRVALAGSLVLVLAAGHAVVAADGTDRGGASVGRTAIDPGGPDPSVARAVAIDGEWEDRSVWARTYLGGLRSEGDQVFLGASRTDDGYLLTGPVESYVGTSDGDVDGYVVETDRRGRRTWGRGYLTFGTHHRVFHDVARVAAGRYLYAGTVNGPSRFVPGTYWLFEADRQVTGWEYRSGSGAFYDVVRGRHDGYVVVGSGRTLALANESRETVRWRATYPDGVTVRAGAASADGYALAGHEAGSANDARTAYALVLTPAGETSWQRGYGTDRPSRFRGVAARPEGGYVFAGDLGPSDNRTARIVATDETGDPVWTDRPLGSGSTLHAAVTGPDGRIAVAGRSPTAGGVVLVYEASGDLVSRQAYGAVLRDVIRAGDRTFLAAGATEGDGRDAFAVRIERTPPSAGLAVDPGRAELNRTEVRLDANASRDNVAVSAYRWDVDGDGTVDAVTNRSWTTHRYADAGVHRPSVTVVDAAGLTATADAPVRVRDTTPPRPALAHPTDRLAATSAPTILDASASVDNDRVARYRWDVDGDGSVDHVSDAPIFRHRFAPGPKRYNVTVTAVDPAGNANATTVPIRIRPNDEPRLHATVGREPDRGTGDGAWRLRASVEDEVGTVRVAWHLPNGTVATGRDVRVTSIEDHRAVRVVATDEYGGRDVETVMLEPPEPPPPDDAGPDTRASEALFDPTLVELLRLLLGLLR
jgi:hypothetical protein